MYRVFGYILHPSPLHSSHLFKEVSKNFKYQNCRFFNEFLLYDIKRKNELGKTVKKSKIMFSLMEHPVYYAIFKKSFFF